MVYATSRKAFSTIESLIRSSFKTTWDTPKKNTSESFQIILKGPRTVKTPPQKSFCNVHRRNGDRNGPENSHKASSCVGVAFSIGSGPQAATPAIIQHKIMRLELFEVSVYPLRMQGVQHLPNKLISELPLQDFINEEHYGTSLIG